MTARFCADAEHTLVKTPPAKDGSAIEYCSKCGKQTFDWAKCSAGGKHDLHQAPEHHQLHPPKYWVRCSKCNQETEWPPQAVHAQIHPTKNTTSSHYHALRKASGEPPRPRPDHGKAFREQLKAHRAKQAALPVPTKPAAPMKKPVPPPLPGTPVKPPIAKPKPR
jgi:hypothetical protein